MTDLATLYIKIRSDGSAASKDLKGVGEEARKVEKATESAAAGFKKMANDAVAASNKATAAVKTAAAEQLKAIKHANDENAKYWLAKQAFERRLLNEEVTARKIAEAEKLAAVKHANDENAKYQLALMANNKRMAKAEMAAYAENVQRAEQPWKTLGIRSTAVIQAEIDAVRTAAYKTQAIYSRGSQDWVNIERAKNEKLKALNKEMVGSHDMSMAAMMRGVLRLYAAFYVLYQVVQLILIPFKKGFLAVEEYNTAIAGLAAMVVTFTERQKGMDAAGQWQEALRYATQMVPILEQIAAKTLLSGQETVALNNAFARQGVFLKANNEKQIEGFVAISNALPYMTQGQEIMRQINTEIRALMTGQGTASAILLKTLKEIDPEIKKHLVTWRANEEVYEHVGELLKAFIPASKILELQWKAVKTTLDTTVTQTLRGGMEEAYNDIIASVLDLNNYLLKHKDEIIQGIKDTWVAIKKAVADVKPVATDLFGIFWDIWVLSGWIADKIDEIPDLAASAASVLTGVPAQSSDVLDKAMEDWGDTIKAYLKALAQNPNASFAQLKQIVENVKSYQAELEAEEQKMAGNPDFNFKPKPGIDEEAIKAAKTEAKRLEGIKKSSLEQMLEDERKNAYELEAIGQSQHEQDMLRMGQEAEAYYNKTKDKVAVAQWVKSEMAVIDAKEAQRRKEVDNDITSATQDNIDELALMRESEYGKQLARIEVEKQSWIDKGASDVKAEEWAQSKKAIVQKKAHDDYMQMVKEMEDYSVDQHTNSVNQIIRQEKEMLDKIEALKGTGSISSGETSTSSTLAHNSTWEQMQEEMDSYMSNLSTSYDTMARFADDYKDKVFDYIDKEAEYRKNVLHEGVSAEEWATNEKLKFNKRYTQAKTEFEINSMAEIMGKTANMFDMASKLAKEDSKTRQALSTASKVATIAEIALQAEKNLMIAVGAVVQQGTGGDTYTAFARIAAMIAVVTAVLSIAGIAFGGSSSGSGPTVAEPPMSSALGAESGDVNESVANSLKLLQDTYSMEYSELTGIYNEMVKLNNNITGLVANLVKAKVSTRNLGVDTSDMASGFSSHLEKTWDLVFGENTWVNLLMGGMGDMAKVAGSVINEMFGGGVTKKITGSGIAIFQKTVSDYINDELAAAFQYVTVKTTKEGGWVADDKTSYANTLKKLNEETTLLFTKVFKNMSSTLVYLAEELGADTQAALDYSFGKIHLNLQGMNASQVDKAVNTWISNLSDKAIKKLFGDMLITYQQVGEGLTETATRIVVDKAVVLDTLEMTGQSFVGTTAEIIAFSEELINMAGDLDTLRDAAETYYDKFFSDAEKQIDLQGSLTDAMEYINQTLPVTREAYRQLVEGLDLTTEAGKEAYIILTADAEAADQYYSYIEELQEKQRNLDIELMEATGDTAGALAAKRQDELAAMDETLRATQQAIWAANDLTDANEAAADAAKTAAQLEATNRSLYIQLMEAEGHTLIATLSQRADELAAMDESSQVIQQLIWARQDENAAAEAAAELAKQQRNLDIQLMEAQGNTAEATAMQRADELAAMDETLRATQEMVWARQDENTATEAATELAKQRRDLEIQLMDTTEATLATRADELAALDESLRPLQELVWAREDENAVIEAAAELAKQRRDLEIQLMEVSGDTVGALAAKRADELAALDESLRALQLEIWAKQDATTAAEEATKAAEDALAAAKDLLTTAQDALKSSFEAEKTRLTTLYDAEIKALNERLDATKTIVSDLTSSVSMLEGAKNTLIGGSNLSIQYFAAQKELTAALTKARAGDFSGVSGLSSALGTLTSGDTSMFTSSEDYKRNYYRNLAAITELQGLTQTQLTAEEKMVDLLQNQIDTATTLHNEQMEAMDAQMNALLHIDTNTLSIAQAIQNLAIAEAAVTGATIPAFASGGYFGGGLAIVGENGPELVKMGPGTIYNNSQSKALADTGEVLKELKALRAEVKTGNTNTYYIIKHSKKSADILDDFNVRGLPAERAA